MVDLHSHLIWGIDDDSKSREMTINMLRQSVNGWTSKLVLTPHYLPGYYEVPINKVREKAEELSLLTKEEVLDIEIYCGQEVYFITNVLENFQNNLIGTINESRYMLIEFIKEGFLFQLNIGSITGDFGKEVKKTAELFLKNKIYSFFGSDAHRDEKRTPNMGEGIEALKNMDRNYFLII